MSYNTDAEEAEHVATWLAANHQPGTTWRSMAVLARTNAQLEVVAGYLDAAGIPNERRGPEHSPASDLFVAPDTSTRRTDDEQHDAVALSTIHRAKGLEFKHVAAIGWAEGQLPNYNATTAAELAEEQRLAYVALSRAEDSVLITWSRGRNDPRYPDRVAVEVPRADREGHRRDRGAQRAADRRRATGPPGGDSRRIGGVRRPRARRATEDVAIKVTAV